MNYKNLIMAVLFIPIFTITGCKSREENRKGVMPQGAEVSDSVIPSQNISIFEASLNGRSAEVIQILEKGADVNAKDQDGHTALMYAAYNGHTMIMEKLIRQGASVDIRDGMGRTALMLASSGPFPEAVKLLLTNHADPNIADTDEHFTALMYAAAEGQLEVVRLLLAAKADPAMKDIDGDNAVSFAENNGHRDIVNLLRTFIK